MIQPAGDVENGTIDADIIVVGAGIAGLILATRLAKRGLRVVVLESGDERQEGDTHPLNAVEQLGVHYAGADHGRFRCVGGTSTRWGGALIPFAAADMSQLPPHWDADWLGIHADLMPFVPEAERLFRLPPGPYADAGIAPLPVGGGAFQARSAKWPAFARRNVAELFRDALRSAGGPTVVSDATVTGFDFRADGRLDAVEATSRGGKRLAARAPSFVLAAGAIESTRLLLLADRAAGDRVLAPHGVIGRYFHDHLSVAAFRLDAGSGKALNRMAGWRFEGDGMRNVRFEPDVDLRRNRGLPASFSNIAFAAAASGGFDLLRDILRGIQRREPMPPGMIAKLIAEAPWLTRAAWWRLASKRLLFPARADFAFHCNIELTPRRDSRIALSRRLDVFGQSLASIDWRIADDDRVNLANTAEALAEGWRASPHAALATLTPLPMTDATFVNGGGIYHPGGTTRIGRSAATGVLDRDLRVFGIPNLSVAATSAFPTGGGANPTMMLILATLRLAERLQAEHARTREPVAAVA